MVEYIEREKVLSKAAPVAGCFSDMISAYDVIMLPASDVAPVVHGRWIEPTRLYYGAKQYECSLCCSDAFWNKYSITVKYPHCPNCGAKMDLEDPA